MNQGTYRRLDSVSSAGASSADMSGIERCLLNLAKVLELKNIDIDPTPINVTPHVLVQPPAVTVSPAEVNIQNKVEPPFVMIKGTRPRHFYACAVIISAPMWLEMLLRIFLR